MNNWRVVLRCRLSSRNSHAGERRRGGQQYQKLCKESFLVSRHNVDAGTFRIARRGFTLMEMAVCLVIMAVAASVVVPAISRLGNGKPESAGDQLISLLKQARNYAIERNYTVTVRIDPVSSRYRVDTTGTGGMGVLVDTTFSLGDAETLETALDRLQFTFKPTGAVMGDTVIVRGIGTTSVLTVDPWTGEAKLVAR